APRGALREVADVVLVAHDDRRPCRARVGEHPPEDRLEGAAVCSPGGARGAGVVDLATLPARLENLGERMSLVLHATSLLDPHGEGAAQSGPMTGCPDDEAIANLSAGVLDEDERAALTAHLDVCAACRTLVAAAAPVRVPASGVGAGPRRPRAAPGSA